MRILLLGEFSNIHWTLAEGLRHFGHEVCVVSDGNHWKNYPRNIDLYRATNGKWDGVKYIARLISILPKLRGFDIVQIVNPCFLSLRPEKSMPVYRYLRRHNGRVFLGAFGTDHYYVHTCMNGDVFKYSDFKTGEHLRASDENREIIKECLYGGTVSANREIAESCDGIVACLWEYYISYKDHFPAKVKFIPLPLDTTGIESRVRDIPEKVNFFIGIQSERHHIKGTDIMLPVLEEVERMHSDLCTVTKAVDVPFTEYQRLMNTADVQLDQLYAYTPSMNSLLAMAKGVIVCGGGEPENYEILGEEELRPIVNIVPDEEELYTQLSNLLKHKERIPRLSAEGIEYVHRHHNYIEVAKQYITFWESN